MTNPDYEMHLRPEEDYEMHFDDAGLKPEQTATVTPTYEEQTVKPDPGCVFSEVTVEAITEPTEEIDITENGVVNVARYGTANVAVPVGVFPEGTKVITQNVTGEDVTNYAAVDVAVPGPTGTKQINITANGTTTEDVSEYADAEITVNTDPAKGLVFGDYDSDGYPHSARLVGSWTTIPEFIFYYYFSILKPAYTGYYPTYGKYIEEFIIPDGVTTIGQGAFVHCSAIKNIVIPSSVRNVLELAFSTCYSVETFSFPGDIDSFGYRWAFRECSGCKSFIFGGNVANIPNDTFQNCSGVLLYDFSHCTAIPALYSTASLGHASGCVIRIPAALSDTTLGEGNGWESATNWSALTNIVWEVV